MNKNLTRIALLAMLSFPLLAQDRGSFEEYTNTFLNHIETENAAFKKKEEPPEKKFWLDVSKKTLPQSKNDFQSVWHFPPISQGLTGTCWAFSTTSFLESELFRLHQVEVDLSELYTVYWEYVEKAKGYVQSQGSTIFEEGSQSQAVLRMMAQYGAVPQEAYAGMQPGQPFHDHAALHEEMQAFLHGVKQNHMWHEGFVVETIRGILDRYLTPPPETFEYQGQTYTPKRFFDEVMRLNLDDYVDLISLLEKPTYTYVSYDVPDNWWQGSAYFNVTLEDFMATLRRSMAEGYSICLGGDVSEGGYLPLKDVAMVPSYDIPSQYIDAYARQFRFSNQTTTDDHGIHCVGTTQVDGEHWYLIKDSGSGSRNGREPGYYFYHEDYIKLKMMNIMVHKDMVTELLQRQQP